MRLELGVAAFAIGILLMFGIAGCGEPSDPVAAASKDVIIAPSAASYEASVKADEEQRQREEQLQKKR